MAILLRFMDSNSIMLTNVIHELGMNVTSNLNIQDAAKSYLMLFPILIILQFILEKQRVGKSFKINLSRFVIIQIFGFVCIGILSTTGAPNIWYIIRHGLNYFGNKLYLKPFRMLTREQVGYALNVLLFVPFGFIVSLIRFKRGRRACLNTVVFGFIFSMTIETLQLFNLRTTDVDDVLTNTVGAFLGYMMFELFYILSGRKLKKYCDSQNLILNRELILYWCVIMIFWIVKP